MYEGEEIAAYLERVDAEIAARSGSSPPKDSNPKSLAEDDAAPKSEEKDG